MLTRQERELVDYYKNWKPGKKAFVQNKLEEPIKVEVQMEDIRLDRLAMDIVDNIRDII